MKKRLLTLICAAAILCASSCNSAGNSAETTTTALTSSQTTTVEETTTVETTTEETTTAETTTTVETTVEETTTAETTTAETTTIVTTTTVTTAETTKAETTTTAKPVTKKTTKTTTAVATTTAVITTTEEATKETTTQKATVDKNENSNKNLSDMSTAEIVADMGIGINLGNTYESCGDWIAQWGDGTPESYETAWGSPVITKEIIQGYKDEGFGVLRVPVAWSNLMGSDYTISSEYVETVREAVDWALDSGLYVIVNLHYDSGWLEKLPTEKEDCLYRYSRIWEQVCEAFKDYDERLVFESQNEELGWNSVWNPWGGTAGKDESYELVNEVNQTFVDIVRGSGGNNPKRHLLISGYQTNIDYTCDELFEMPDDPAGRCAVSVHYYSPAGFAILTENADWGKAEYTWGTASDFAYLESQMDMMKKNFADRGIPVIIGEYGCPTKNKDEDSVRLYISSVCEAAYTRGMCPVLWSTTGEFYSRTECKMIDETLSGMLDKIIE